MSSIGEAIRVQDKRSGVSQIRKKTVFLKHHHANIRESDTVRQSNFSQCWFHVSLEIPERQHQHPWLVKKNVQHQEIQCFYQFELDFMLRKNKFHEETKTTKGGKGDRWRWKLPCNQIGNRIDGKVYQEALSQTEIPSRNLSSDEQWSMQLISEYYVICPRLVILSKQPDKAPLSSPEIAPMTVIKRDKAQRKLPIEVGHASHNHKLTPYCCEGQTIGDSITNAWSKLTKINRIPIEE